MTKTLGVIGPGKHFIEKIYPVLIKSDFFQLNGILRKKNKSFKDIKLFDEKNFFKKKFDFIYISCPNKYAHRFDSLFIPYSLLNCVNKLQAGICSSGKPGQNHFTFSLNL